MSAKVWVAYYDDFSELAVFTSELECLRYAVDHTPMEVIEAETGRGVREQVREQWGVRMAAMRTKDA